MQNGLWLLWLRPLTMTCPWPLSKSIVIFILTTKSSTSLLEIKFDSVCMILYLVKSATENPTPLVTRLAIALLNTLSVNNSSMSQQFCNSALFNSPVTLYLFTNLPCLDKFSYITANMASISFLLGEFTNNSLSILNIVMRNLRVKGKQNLGFQRMSQAMMDNTQSIFTSVVQLVGWSYGYGGLFTQRVFPNFVKQFIILRMRSLYVMRMLEWPFYNIMLIPFSPVSKTYS